jgi:photosystem II stability/assembly factor-like uncharacterized protein
MKRFVLLLAALSALFLSHPARGQWNFVNNFSSTSNVNSIYFLDDIGVPTTGFVGVGTDVFRTVNGGTTWTKVLSVPSGWTTGFVFKNASIGWCCVAGNQTTPAIYKTINGGISWVPLSPVGLASDVKYNAAKGWLFLSTHTGIAKSLVSADDGNTWGPINSSMDENGFAFCDSLHGILSAHTSPFCRTSDGGFTWYSLGLTIHSWSPIAIPGTNTFVAAEDITSNMHCSTDAGATWTAAGTVPGTLTGCVQAGPCNVYVQSSQGMFHSTDLATWIPMGGPGNGFDTRFFVGTRTIYAADGAGNLYEQGAFAGGWPSLDYSPHTLDVTLAAGCGPKMDTAIFVNPTCLPLTVLSASVIDSNIWSIMPNQPIPLMLGSGDTMRIAITAHDDSVGTFHDELRLLLRTIVGTTDTVLFLNLTAAPMTPPTLRSASVSLPDRCTSADTVFYIRNNNCDTIQIASLAMLDTSLFDLLPLSLPIALAPDSQYAIPVSAIPKMKGTFADSVTIVLTANGFTLDTSLVLYGTVGNSALAASLTPDSIAFDTVLECNTKFDTLYLRNISCDSFQITQASISSKPFVLLDSVRNTWVAPGDSIAIVIALSGSPQAGDDSDDLSLILNNSGSQESLLIPLTGSVRSTPTNVYVSTDTITADSISACSEFDTAILITAQTGCDSISINSLKYAGTGNVNITVSPAFPTVLHTGDTVRFNVSYSPAGTGAANGIIHIKGVGIDTTITLHITVRDDAQPVQLAVSRTSFTARPCGLDSATITLSNPGCIPVTLDSLVLYSGSSEFTLPLLSLPFNIPADSTISTMIYFSGNGSSSSSSPIFDTLHTHDGTGHAQHIPVLGTILPIDTAHVGIALNMGSTLTPIVGGMTSPLLYFNDTVATSNDLQSMHCVMTFNGNVLTEIGSTYGLSGWNVQEQSGAPSGTLDLLCTRSSTSVILPGQPIASVLFQADLSDSVSTPITLTSVTFSPADPTYEQCTLASAIAPPSIEIQLAPQCGDSIILRTLRNEPLLTSVQVLPQESDMLVSFRSREASEVTITLRDMLGRLRTDMMYDATSGMNAITLPSTQLEQGMYFVELSAGGSRIVKQVGMLR